MFRLGAGAARILDSDLVQPQGRESARLIERLDAAGVLDPVPYALPALPLEDLTVVVPVRDNPSGVARLLSGLEGLQVIVVDDASHDVTVLAAVCEQAFARLVRLDENIGPAGARNRGLAWVTTPFVAFVDSDVVVSLDQLALVLRHFHDPMLALAAPRIASYGGRGSVVARYEETFSSLDRGPAPALVRPHSTVAWLPSACLLARTGAVTDGFDEALRAGEDVDLVWRLVDQGWRVRYEPAAVVRHEPRANWGSWMGRKAFYGTSAGELGRRHGDAIAPAVLSGWAWLFLAGLVVQRKWSVALALAGWMTGLARSSRRLGRGEARLAARLTWRGSANALAQGQALVLRHWWPVALVSCLVSRRARRVLLVAAAADLVMSSRRTDLNPVALLVTRRLDDAAYGVGVWLGAARVRSWRALLPGRPGPAPVSRGGGSAMPAGSPRRLVRTPAEPTVRP